MSSKTPIVDLTIAGTGFLKLGDTTLTEANLSVLSGLTSPDNITGATGATGAKSNWSNWALTNGTNGAVEQPVLLVLQVNVESKVSLVNKVYLYLEQLETQDLLDYWTYRFAVLTV